MMLTHFRRANLMVLNQAMEPTWPHFRRLTASSAISAQPSITHRVRNEQISSTYLGRKIRLPAKFKPQIGKL